MENNPQVDRIFRLCADIESRHRIGVAVSLIATEAARLSQVRPDLEHYMNVHCGPDWQTRQNGGIAATLAFITYLSEDRFNKPQRVSLEA